MPEDNFFLRFISFTSFGNCAGRAIIAGLLSTIALGVAHAAESATNSTCVVLAIEGKLDVALKGAPA